MERGHLEDLYVDGVLYYTDTGEIGWEGVDWIDVAEDGDKWRAVVNQ
jgi:hypothetical protein